MYQNRDFGINHIKARKDHRCYGMGLGIIILDDVYPIRQRQRPQHQSVWKPLLIGVVIGLLLILGIMVL